MAPKVHLSEPFFIRSFLFNPFVAQLLTLLLIGGTLLTLRLQRLFTSGHILEVQLPLLLT